MQPAPEDRLSTGEGKKAGSSRLKLAVLVVAVIIGVVYFASDRKEPPVADDPATMAPAAAPPLPAALPPAPDIPAIADPVVQSLPEAPPPEPPVTLEGSDLELRETLAGPDDSTLIAQALQSNDLVHRSAGLIDGLSRGLVPRKILPLPPPQEKFSTRTAADGQTYVDPASYTRYDSYSEAIASLDADQLAAVFHRYRSLLEQAYTEFGYSAGDMDNALIRSLDNILATPELTEPVALKRKEAVFIYVDPALEQLSPLQKQVLRMGPENAAIVKRQAELLRNALLGASQ